MKESGVQHFEHRIDKRKIPVCTILGVDIAAINMDWLVKFTVKNINSLSGDYMCVSNVHTTMTAWKNENYRIIQNNAIMAIPDGGPLSSVGQKRGYNQMERIAGPSYMKEIFEISEKYGYRHYFYGSTEETLGKLSRNLKKNYPALRIVGMYSPPFRNLDVEEEETILTRINATKPDFVWVGLGAPKQEKWMSKQQGKIYGFMVGVGAGFDYFAGNIKRAPKWMQENNLEWLYRLIQDPKRLFWRYLNTNFSFIWNACILKK